MPYFDYKIWNIKQFINSFYIIYTHIIQVHMILNFYSWTHTNNANIKLIYLFNSKYSQKHMVKNKAKRITLKNPGILFQLIEI